MLVLSRKEDQQIIIDDDIQVVVLKITGNTIRLGISAPSDIKVLRGELEPWGEWEKQEQAQTPEMRPV